MVDEETRIESQDPGPALETELAERFRHRLLVFAARRVRERSVAEDVAQDTLRRVLEALRSRRVKDPNALPAFVFQTARHVCQVRLRSLPRQSRALEKVAREEGATRQEEDLLSGLIRRERREAVRAALKQLEENDCELLRLLFHEGLETAEVAERLGISAGALRVRKHRALSRLGDLLGEKESGNGSRRAETTSR